MIPQISPGKTWEGFAGAILFSMVFDGHWAGDHLVIFPVADMDLGGVLGVGAVVGDLVESILKRGVGSKLGRFLPGIGVL